ncbi:site-specific integrase [Cohaesibacter celericrescens]|uniref:Integrase n=1 Tax=Cohaesibacter celericrescens TaxID=2067669 RepID=A0A2N5XQJ2_9HYPH|nr:site-specific integrase [Cohaesibacter celericrescens]PLW76786.1 integrase [Cohaesibacter celericrescens]
MGTINERKRKNGSVAYCAQIVIKRDGNIVHRESKTFDRKRIAEKWLYKREDELSKPDALKKQTGKTLANAIDKYVKTSQKQIGRTKTQVLNTIKNEYDIAQQDCSDINSQALVEFVEELNTRMTPQTAQNYMSHLGAIFSIAKPAWGFQLNKQAHVDAMAVSKRLGLTGKAVSRERRPTLQELDLLIKHFQHKAKFRKQSIPMQHIIPFALFSTRRQEEICTIQWDDLDREGKRILVRDMKNPGEKIGNNVWCDLPDPCLDIIEAQPETAAQIFPYNHRSISAAFTRACHFLQIEDLRFHDLRHEGASRLFEMGYNIPHAAAVTGHRSWSSLKRYTHIRQTGDKYEGWNFIDSLFFQTQND